MSKNNNHQMDNLFLKLLENCISDSEIEKLDRLFSDNAGLVDDYCEFVKNYTALKMKLSDEVGNIDGIEEQDVIDLEFWRDASEYEKNAPAIEIEKPLLVREPIKMLKIEKSPRTVNKFSLCSAMISVAAVIILLVYMQYIPPAASTVAVIADSMNAKWAPSEFSTEIGGRLWDNEGIRCLQKGMIKIVFNYRAEVIIEGPAEFELESSEKIHLYSGRLYATVPKGATGFIVQTPYSTVIDLGTEFGVEVDIDGSTDVHMLKGKASLIPGKTGNKEEGVGLLAGQAKSVNTRSKVDNIELLENRFVRHINSQKGFVWRGEDLSLTDLLGRGNGFGTGVPVMEIDPLTGGWSNRNLQQMSREGNGQFWQVHNLSFVDGVFVPNGLLGQVQIASNGLSFDDFPMTSNETYASIGTDKYFYDHGVLKTLTMNGIVPDSILLMHSNCGITFDLNELRELAAGRAIEKFQAKYGIPETVFLETQSDKIASVDIYVLIDGIKERVIKNVFYRERMSILEIDLDQDDRFLTLCVTDNNLSTRYDWLTFIDPIFDVE